MSNIKVTQERIDHLLETADIQVKTIFEKCTVVAVRLENGFILTESSACVDPANYDPKMGEEICLEHIRNKLWELEGYALQERLYWMKCWERDHCHNVPDGIGADTASGLHGISETMAGHLAGSFGKKSKL